MELTILAVVTVVVTLLLGWQWMVLRKARKSIGKASPDGDAGVQVYFFHAPHCGPCRGIKPLVERLSGEFPNLVAVNVTAEPERAQAFRIFATPSFVCVKDGVISEVRLGAVSESWLRARLTV